MNPIKTPNNILMENAGMVPAYPGMAKSPDQMLMDQSGVAPGQQGGITSSLSPQQMLAMMLAYNQTPQQFAGGGKVKEPEMSPEFIRALLLAYDQMPPIEEPTMQAQPKTAVGVTRDQVAKIIGEKAADRLFGTGTEGQQTEYLPLQLLNPLLYGAQAADLYKQSGKELEQGQYGSAAGSSALAGLSAIPVAGPAGRAAQKIIKKIK